MSELRKEIYEHFEKFEQSMSEARLMKEVGNDLKIYRSMIRIKRYD